MPFRVMGPLTTIQVFTLTRNYIKSKTYIHALNGSKSALASTIVGKKERQ